MEISIVRERAPNEGRIVLTPRGVATLLAMGHQVLVEDGAGAGSGHPNVDYEGVGARIVWSREEAFGRGDLVLKVSRPTAEEIALLPAGGAIAAFMHFAAAPHEDLQTLASKSITALALELLEVDGSRPILTAMSEIAGRLCPQLAARYLETTAGGRGVLLSGAPGVAPAEVVILGAGVLGSSAARAFAALGAHVTILDNEVRHLRVLEHLLGGGIAYLHANEVTVTRSVSYADVVVGAVLVPGERAPVLVSKQTIGQMRPGAVLLDLSIDQGGCFESSRPTTLADPVFQAHGAIHYCAPNTPALVARTASHALSHEFAPLLAKRIERLADALQPGHPLATAVAFYSGMPVRQAFARALGVEAASLGAILGAPASGQGRS